MNALALAGISLALGGLHHLTLHDLAVHTVIGVDPTLVLLLMIDAAVVSTALILTTASMISLVTLLFSRLHDETAQDAPASGALPEVVEGEKSFTRRRPVLSLLLIGAFLVAATLLTLPAIEEDRSVLERRSAVTAHRGNSSVAPENTLAALRAAIEEGADYAEIDILEAKDGALVVIHDSNLKRLAGLDKNVYEMTGAELHEVDVGSHFDPKFSAERIPSLEEAIRTAGDVLDLNIELKVHGHEKQLVESAVALIRAMKFERRCVITSLDASVLAAVRALAPTLPVGIILTAAVGNVHAMDVDFYSVNSLVATTAFIRAAHKRGRAVHVWTLNEPDKILRILERFPDNVISDYPGTRAQDHRVAHNRGNHGRGRATPVRPVAVAARLHPPVMDPAERHGTRALAIHGFRLAAIRRGHRADLVPLPGRFPAQT